MKLTFAASRSEVTGTEIYQVQLNGRTVAHIDWNARSSKYVVNGMSLRNGKLPTFKTAQQAQAWVAKRLGF